MEITNNLFTHCFLFKNCEINEKSYLLICKSVYHLLIPDSYLFVMFQMPEFPSTADSQMTGQWAQAKTNMTTVPRATASTALANSQQVCEISRFIFVTYKQHSELCI